MRPVERILISIERQGDSVRNLLLGTTPDVSQDDLKEIMDWVYAMNIVSVKAFNPFNLVFFPLPSGCSAIGRLLLDVRSFRQDQKEIFFLQILLVSSDTLRAFENNPVRIYERALTSGQLLTESFFDDKCAESLMESFGFETNGDLFVKNFRLIGETAPAELAPFELDCSLEKSDENELKTGTLKGLTADPGTRVIVVIIQSILDSMVTYFEESGSSVHLINGIFNLLPIHWRPELSFSIGLHFDGEHYLRLVSCNKKDPKNGPEPNMPYIDPLAIKEGRANFEIVEGWPLLIELVLQKEAFTFLNTKLIDDYQERCEKSFGEPETFCDTETIHVLGFEWLYQLKHFLSQNPELSKDQDRLMSRADQAHPLLETDLPYPENLRPGLEFEKPLVLVEGSNILSPFQRLSARFPDRVQDLTRLDSLIAHFLGGSFFSKDVLEKFWMDLRKRSESDFLWSVREEYIHYIRSYLLVRDTDQFDSAMKENIAALDIINLLIT